MDYEYLTSHTAVSHLLLLEATGSARLSQLPAQLHRLVGQTLVKHVCEHHSSVALLASRLTHDGTDDGTAAAEGATARALNPSAGGPPSPRMPAAILCSLTAATAFGSDSRILGCSPSQAGRRDEAETRM